jgi:hypothetical protein
VRTAGEGEGSGQDDACDYVYIWNSWSGRSHVVPPASVLCKIYPWMQPLSRGRAGRAAVIRRTAMHRWSK